MTHTNSSTLPPQAYRSECFAEDLGESGEQPSCQLRFPFPIAPYPTSTLPWQPATLTTR